MTRSLTTRYLDFWLLGGASVVLWAVMYIAESFRPDTWAVDQHFANLAPLSATLALIVNHPHFMASYKLAYGREKTFLFRYWFQLVLVPVLLIGTFVLAYFLTHPELGSVLAWMSAVPGELGRQIMGYMVALMFLTVGWHYAKQVYGCMMVYANYDGYSMTKLQRNLLKYSLFLIWWLRFVTSNFEYGTIDYYGVAYPALAFPGWVKLTVSLSLGICLLFVVFGVFVRNFQKSGQSPSWNLLIPYIAFFLWWSPVTFQGDFYIYAVPFFHSLQYLVFIYRTERRRLHIGPRNRELTATLLISGLVVIGYISFELAPSLLDRFLRTDVHMKFAFFFIASQVFINVHHYFIDNALWRFDDSEVKKYLLAEN